MITTWMLMVLFAYSNSGGPNEPGNVALQSEKVDFFSKEECNAAKQTVLKAAAEAGYRRTVAVCFQRGSSLMEK